MKLWTENLPGNIHTAANTINSPNFWIEWDSIVTMYVTGNYVITAFLVTELEFNRLKHKYHNKEATDE